MTDAFEKSARLLIHASFEDRAWILSQLASEERIRIAAALQDMLAMPDAHVMADTLSGANNHQGRQSFNNNEQSILETVDGGTMAKLLANEPDWIVAILVSDARWPWIENYLAGLDPRRLEAIEHWARAGHGNLKPRVTEALIRRVAERLACAVPEAIPPSAFEQMLARVKTQTPSSLQDNAEVSA